MKTRIALTAPTLSTLLALLIVVTVSPALFIVAALSSSLALVAVNLRHRRPPVRPANVAPRTAALLAAGASPRVAQALGRGDRIAAIIAYREEHQVGLREGKAAIDTLAQPLDHPM